jgi:hypothetical protein
MENSTVVMELLLDIAARGVDARQKRLLHARYAP